MKLSDNVKEQKLHLPLPKDDKFIWDDADSYAFNAGASIIGVNRSQEIWWHNKDFTKSEEDSYPVPFTQP